MSQTLVERIEHALRGVTNARTRTNVVAGEMVRDVATTRDGKVRLTLLLDAADDAALVRDVRQALERLDGVTDVRVDVKDPAQAQASRPAAPAPTRMLPVMDTQAPSAPRVPAQQPTTYPNLGKVLAVSSGKGGVGKSTVATNLAVALARMGHRVGILDADVYGPNIPRMMGVSEPPRVVDEKIVPLEAHGVKLISLGFLIERDQPAIWRGPIVMKIIGQFLRDVQWGQLDFLIVDMPPGTGDAQLSLVQSTPVDGAVIVTTPQEVAAGDALRGAKMFQRVNVPVLGIVENMSWFESPETGKPLAIFGSGGGQRLADELEVPLLGNIPLYPPVLVGGDAGTPIVAAEPQSSAARALTGVAQKVAEALAAVPMR
ncbi:MAG TPA: Mrp/NBP35 family ATP-binding protein [Gemmatimonadaceae bacterium]|nr:Mrp/NBP35 family ATP-binding protein [Gemmatimonadaceae bacterium]